MLVKIIKVFDTDHWEESITNVKYAGFISKVMGENYTSYEIEITLDSTDKFGPSVKYGNTDLFFKSKRLFMTGKNQTIIMFNDNTIHYVGEGLSTHPDVVKYAIDMFKSYRVLNKR